MKALVIGYNMLMPPNDNEAKWSYAPQDQDEKPKTTGSQTVKTPPQQSVAWTASEFIDNQKGPGWYLLFIGGIVLISVLVFIFTHDYISSVVITLAGIIFVILTKRKPKQLPYEINNKGIQIGVKFYQYDIFKSFGMGQDGAIRYISLMPLKRFMPEIAIYFPPEQEMAIVNILADHLPHDQPLEKSVDKLFKKLNF